MSTVSAIHPQRGFTLVEMLIAVSIFALIMLGLVAGIYTLGNSLDRSEAKANQITEMTLVTRHLRHLLTETAPRFGPETDQPNPFFQGQNDELVFVSNFSAFQGPGGLHWVRLSLNEQQTKPAVLRMQYERLPADPERLTPNWSEPNQQVLVQHVDALTIRYRDEDGVWQNSWTEAEILPQAISMTIRANQQSWPELVVWLEGGRSAYRAR